MIILMIVSLYTSRVVLSILGIEDYGIYNLVGGFVGIFSFISGALVSAIQRYFNVALGEKNDEKFKRIYSMSINMFTFFSLLLLLIGETIGVWFVKNELNIPEGREHATMIVFHLSIITLIVNLFRTTNNAAIIAHEKMNFYAYTGIMEAVLKLLIVFALSFFDFDKLALYASLYLVVTIIINIIYKTYCYKKITACRYNMIWDKALFRELIGFSGLNLIESGARTGLNQGTNFFINRYYSVTINATQGISAQIYNAINTFVTNFQTAFKPQLIKTYAANEMDTHYTLLYMTSKFSFYLMVLIVIPVIFNLDNLLDIWLVNVPPYTNHFCIFILMAYLADSLGAPLHTSIYANGNIKGIKISNTIVTLLQLVLCYYLLKHRVAPYISAILTLFAHITFLIIAMYYAKKLCGVSIKIFTKKVLLPALKILLLSLVVPFIIRNFATNIWSTLLFFLLDVFWIIFVIYLLGLTKDERIFIKNNILSKIKIIK